MIWYLQIWHLIQFQQAFFFSHAHISTIDFFLKLNHIIVGKGIFYP